MTGSPQPVVGVFSAPGPYRAAVAELPLRTRATGRAAGAIAVIPGAEGWVDAALVAARTGAAAVVVADPVFTASAELYRLADAPGIPLIVERPLLRADLVRIVIGTRADAPARVVVADAAAPRGRARHVARDAVGWLRVLCGDDLAVVRESGGLALLEGPSDVPVTLSVAETTRPGRGWIRVQALGEVVTDMDVEGDDARVSTSTSDGCLVSPRRYESSERLALRRAVEALQGTWPRDLDELSADTELVERLSTGGHRWR
ncbi:hypothetical protein QL996_11010 [Planococcus sp. APC 4015]|nr:hypothetical protein [Planococcus sp. APC 4015]